MKGKETGYAPRASRETRISRPLFKPNLHVSAPGARPARLAASLAPAALRAVQRGEPPPRPSALPLARAPPRFACGAAIGCGGEAGGFPLRAAGIPVRRLADSDSCSRTERPARPGNRPGPAPTPPPTPPPPGSLGAGGVRPARLRNPSEGSRSPARLVGAIPAAALAPELPGGAGSRAAALAARKRSPEFSPRFARRGTGLRQRESSRERFKGLPARDVTSGS